MREVGPMMSDVSHSFFPCQGSSDCLLLVHGGPGMSSDYFEPAIGALAREFNVATYSQGQIFPHSLSNLLRELDCVLAQLERAGLSATFLGHSFGGALVLEYFRRFPNRVRRLILCSWIYDNRFSEYRMKHSRSDLEDVATSSDVSDAETHPDDVYKKDCLARVPRYFSKKYRDAGAQLLRNTRYNAALRDAIWNEFVVNLDLHAVLKGLEIPTLSIAGCDDGFVLHEYTEEGALINPLWIRHEIIADAGHFPFFDNTPGFVEIVREFMTQKKQSPWV
jgi:proline iminopeptidase